MKKLCMMLAMVLCAATMFGCVPEKPEASAEQPAQEAPQTKPSGEESHIQPRETGLAAAFTEMLNSEGRSFAEWTEFTGSAAIRDGEKEVPVSVTTSEDDSCVVDVDTSSNVIEYFYNAKSYIGDVDASDGYTELIVTGDTGSDDYMTVIYRMENGELKQTQINGCVLGLYGDGTMMLEGNVDVLGTYGAQYEYAATMPGAMEFKLSSPFTRVSFDEDWEYLSLTVKKDGLPVKTIGTADAQELALPAGTKLLMMMTDAESEAVLMDEAGNYYLVSVERNEAEWGWMIDSISENEWFDFVPYSG